MEIELLYGSIHIYKYYNNDELFDISHKGFSFDAHYDTDFGCTIISRFTMNSRTANIELSQFVIILALLKIKRNFNSIKLNRYYEKNSEELYLLVCKEFIKILK